MYTRKRDSLPTLKKWSYYNTALVYFLFQDQGFTYLSEVRAKGPVEFGKKALGHQSWENLMQSKIHGIQF